MISAYPLVWPVGYKRSALNQPLSRFKTSFGYSRDEIILEIKRLGGTDPIISSNVPLRQDGIPYANYLEPKDPGVAVYFKLKGKQVVIACDKWKKVVENLHAVRLSINAMRGLDRWGCSEIIERSFTGFAALPAGDTRPWYEVLQVPADADLESVKSAYRREAKKAHPDAGGSAAAFHAVQKAYGDYMEKR